MEPGPDRSPRLLAALALAEAVLIAVLLLMLLRQRQEKIAAAQVGQRLRAESQKRIAELERRSVPPVGAPASPPKSAEDFARRFLRGQADYLRWEASPEIAPLQAVVSRAQFASANAELLRFLRLPPDKVAALRDLMIEEQREQADIGVEARAQGIRDPDAIRKLTAQSEEEIEGRLKAAIGGDSYAQLQYFRQTGAQRGQVRQLQQALSYGEAPLSDEQSEQMVKLLAGSAPPPFAGIHSVPGSYTTMVEGQVMTEDPTSLTDDLVAQAGSILSPVQLETLRSLQAAQQASARIQELSAKRKHTP
ncbi:MAG TPA: hypothetical protein VHC86_01185 [Opitutaceae bacterium]|nr:hypothetical protein [Opitutaceae bacterium]